MINFDKPRLTKEDWNPDASSKAPPTYSESSQQLPLCWDCITPWRTQSPSQSGNTSSLRERINHICRSRSLVRSGKGSPRRATTGDYCRSAISHQRPHNYLLSLRSSLQQRRITVLGTQRAADIWTHQTPWLRAGACKTSVFFQSTEALLCT